MKKISITIKYQMQNAQIPNPRILAIKKWKSKIFDIKDIEFFITREINVFTANNNTDLTIYLLSNFDHLTGYQNFYTVPIQDKVLAININEIDYLIKSFGLMPAIIRYIYGFCIVYKYFGSDGIKVDIKKAWAIMTTETDTAEKKSCILQVALNKEDISGFFGKPSLCKGTRKKLAEQIDVRFLNQLEKELNKFKAFDTLFFEKVNSNKYLYIGIAVISGVLASFIFEIIKYLFSKI